jgi:hypothetical protein
VWENWKIFPKNEKYNRLSRAGHVSPRPPFLRGVVGVHYVELFTPLPPLLPAIMSVSPDSGGKSVIMYTKKVPILAGISDNRR